MLRKNGLVFFVGLLCLLATQTHAATYEATELLATPLDTPPSVTTISWDNTDTGYPDDDDKVVVNIGFDFTFKDTPYNQVRILTNGVLHFGADQNFHRDYANEALPTNKADRFIAAYWDDLVDDGSATVTYGMMGSAPSRSFVVTWNNVKAYANNLRYDFQIVLYENGDIRFRYNNNTSNGESATIGIEVDDSDVTQYSFNNASVRTDFDLVFKNTLLVSPNALLALRMDEDSWGVGSGAVADSSGNGLNGTAVNGPVTNNLNPALVGDPGTCRYGEFDGSNDYLNIPDDPLLDLTGSFTIAAWINIDSIPSSGLKSILSKDENYEFHVNSSGQINWWWQTVTPNNTRQLNSTGTVTPGQWTHVAIRYQSGSQTIFLNGAASGSSSYTGTPRTNSDPLQIGADQNFSGRYFNGDIDEVRIFSVALSNAQIATLASETHFCQTVVEGCSASFPDAVSSHSDGTLSLDTNVGINSPDNQLQFGSISPATNSACGGPACTADSGNPVPAVDPGTFPDTSSFTSDLTVSNNGTGTLGSGGTFQYDQVQVNRNGTLNVNSAVSDYYIDELTLRRDSTLNLREGEYWIRSLTVERNANIKVIGGGSARLFISESVLFERNVWINNSDSGGTTGDPSQLLIYGYSSITFDRNTRVWGAIYSQSNIELGRNSSYTGAITGSNVTISQNTSISYDAAAMANIDLGSLCGGASCTLGSFSITQPSYGLACPQSRSSVHVRAMCSDGTTVKSDYVGTIDLTSTENSESEFYLTDSSSTSINSVTLTSAENGEVDVFLFHKNENDDLKVTAADSSAGISTTAATGTDFRTSGFIASPLNSFVCGGGSTQFTLTAIGQDLTNGGSCNVIEGFTGSKPLKAWSDINIDLAESPVAANSGLPVNMTLNGNNIGSSKPPANNITATFNAGVATFDVGYLDVGEVLGINIIHDEAPYDGTVPEVSDPADPGLKVSTNSFIVFPAKVKVAAEANSSNNPACSPASANCSTFVRANEAFSITAEAVCSDPAETVARSYRGLVDLSHQLVLPDVSTGTPGDLAINEINFDGSSASGMVQVSGQKISEVGVFTLKTQPPAYFLQTIDEFTSENIGRFYPDHFNVSISGGRFQHECAGAFTYMEQPFHFVTAEAPTVTIEARNVDDDRTENYEGDFWKLGPNLYQTATCNGGTGTVTGFCYSDMVGGDAIFIAPSLEQPYPSTINIDGRMVMALHADAIGSNEFEYGRPAVGLVTPFDADVKLDIAIVDGDGAAGNASIEHIGFTGDPDSATPGISLNTTNNEYLRYGRWRMENVFGPETQDLFMPAEAQYYNTAGEWQTNGTDACTTMVMAAAGNTMLVASNPIGTGVTPDQDIPVGTTTTDFSYNATLVNGDGGFVFSPLATAGQSGSVVMSADLNELPWLKFDWDGNGTREDAPTATATFGRYRGHDRIIYWREVTN